MAKSDWTLDDVYKKLKDPNINIHDKYSFNDLTSNKSIRLSLGRIWFNLLLPDDYELINKPIDKLDLQNIFKNIFTKYEVQKSSKIISKMQREAFKLATINPRSFNINAFTTSDEFKKKKQEFKENAMQMTDDEYNDNIKQLTNMFMDEHREKGIGINDGIDAKIGSKISAETWGMLNVAKGNATDMEGNIKRIPTAAGDGYSIEEYYNTTNEARQGLYTKAIAVQEPGYLARKVTMANANQKITSDDCKTKQYLKIKVTKQRAKTLINRYYLNEETNKLEIINDTDQIIDKIIKLRSPLYCKDKKGICSICYGKLYKDLETKNIGILAGGAINNEAINMMMKARHKNSSIDLVKVDFINLINESDISLAFLSKFLIIEKNTIKSKYNTTLAIDKSEYKEGFNFLDFGNKYSMPGILNLSVYKDNDVENKEEITTPFNFKVDIIKPQEGYITKNKSIEYLNYSPGELIFEKDKYIKELDPSVASKLLDGVTKYIKDPKIILNVLSDELSGTDSVHLETIIANIFRSKDDETIPGRLVNYKNIKIIGCKQLPFINSWLTGLAFENINKAVKNAITQDKTAEFNPIEQVMMGQIFTEDQENEE